MIAGFIVYRLFLLTKKKIAFPVKAASNFLNDDSIS